MILPQIQLLQFDQELCWWDTSLIRSPHTRFKFFSSIDAMIKYANVWLSVTENEPGIIMLSGHGMRQRLITNENIVHIDKLLARLSPLSNKSIHFSSCHTLDLDNETLKKTYRQSGAHIISGYQHKINSVDSATIESFIINELNHPIDSLESISRAYRTLWKSNSKLIERTGFCYVSKV